MVDALPSSAGTDISAVIVPDFSGPRGLVFEARTLFFLASWLEAQAAGGTNRCRAHVCGIGEPPASVRRLAAQAGVSWSVHEPLLPDYGGFANKLRGLEAPVAGGRVLLLDADVLVLGALDALHEIEADLAAAPAGKPQVPEEQWQLIYTGLGLPMPAERMASSYGELGVPVGTGTLRYQPQPAEAQSMLPYYNSGSVLVRRGSELRAVWEDCLRRIPAIFQGRNVVPADAVTSGDQVALAVAVQRLREQGTIFELLPRAFNTRLIHFRGGARVGSVRLLHAPGFAGTVSAREELVPAVEQYVARWSEAIREGQSADSAARDQDIEQAREILRHLWERWVREAWEDA
jgi:hypothetical protein